MRITREQITARVGGQLSPSLSLSVVSVSVRYRSHLRVVRAVFSILVHKDDSSLCVMYFFFPLNDALLKAESRE